MQMRVVSPNARLVGAEFLRYSATIRARAVVVVRTFGGLVTAGVKSRAAGRPGPRIRTGVYNASINPQMHDAGLTAEIGTNAPQGRRLEFGFSGVDSLGRHYRQPPFPHFAPAVDALEEPFIAAIARVVDFGSRRG